MRMTTTRDLEDLAEQVNVAFDRANKRIDALEKKIKEPTATQAKKKVSKKT
jgi:hypothetical protein